MKKKLFFVFLATALWSCGDDKKEEDAENAKENQEQSGHDHDHDGHDHDGHDHGDHDHGHEGHDHGDHEGHDHGHNHAAWEGEEEFHGLMEVCFHSMEAENMEPVLGKAREMADAAAMWAGSEIPEEMNQEGVQDLLDLLKTEADGLANDVESGADEAVIKEKLDALHTLFHEVMETAGHSHDHGDHEGHDHGHEGHEH